MGIGIDYIRRTQTSAKFRRQTQTTDGRYLRQSRVKSLRFRESIGHTKWCSIAFLGGQVPPSPGLLGSWSQPGKLFKEIQIAVHQKALIAWSLIDTFAYATYVITRARCKRFDCLPEFGYLSKARFGERDNEFAVLFPCHTYQIHARSRAAFLWGQ